MIRELVDGVYTADHAAADGKNVILAGSRITLAVDGGTHQEEGQQMAQFILDQGRRPDHLLLTHGHTDHVLGCAALATGEVYAHHATVDEMRRQLPTFVERLGVDEREVHARLPQPTVLYRDELTLQLGELSLHLFPTPGHSPDSTSGYVAERNLLIAADTVVTGIVPAIFDSSEALERSIARLRSFDAEVLIAGHGPPLIGRQPIRDWLDATVSYLSRSRDQARDLLRAGVPPGEVPPQLDYDELIGDRLDRSQHRMQWRHRNTVAQIVNELSTAH